MAGGELEKAILKLAEREKGPREFLPKPQSPIPDSAGKGTNALPKSGSGGDLTESNYAERTYHSRKTLRSTDGLITWLYDPIKSVSMSDASGTSVKLTFAAPT